MKLAGIILLAATLHVSAITYGQKVTLHKKDANLIDVIKEIRKQTGYYFIYTDEVIKNANPVTINIKDKQLEPALTELFANQQLSFVIKEQAIVLNLKKENQQQQNTVTVKGKVIGAEDKQPIPGVFVSTADKKSLGVSDANGNFSVRVAKGTEVIFSSIGFAAQKQVLSANNDNLIISLKVDNQQLSEVVVTALGIRREEKALGYAVSTVKGDELQEAMPKNWTDALSGRIAGVNLMKSGAGPAGSNKIVLRGENSLDNESQALIVVDGVMISESGGKLTGNGQNAYLDSDSPVDFGSGLADINPEDIESISVLKGPGASALYGQRGANGAIIITTKQGANTQKGALGIRFNTHTSLGTINRWPDYQYEYGQGLSGQDTWYSYGATVDGPSTRSTSSAWGAKFQGQEFYQYDPATNGAGAVRTPWVAYPNNRKDFFDIDQTYTNSLTISGGNKNTSVRLSYTNVQNKWIVPNTGYNRNTIALSANQNIGDKINISSKINYTNRWSDNLPSVGYNNQTIMYFIRGMVPNADINWFKDYWLPGQEGIEQRKPFSSLLDNPYMQVYEMLNKQNRNGIVGTVSATYKFTPDISLMGRVSTDFSTENRSQQRPYNSQKFQYGMYRTQSYDKQETNAEFLFSYNNVVKTSKFTGSFSIGGSSLTNKYNKDEVRADRLLYPGIYSFANAMDALQTYPYFSQYKVNSLFALVPMSFDNKYFLDATYRIDWSSMLASPESDGTPFDYYSLNGSAILSDIFRFPYSISYWKLRGSIAQTGSGSNTPFRTAYYFSPHPTFPSGLSNPLELPNDNLQPLMTVSYELGTEVRLFGNRAGIDVAVYQNNTFNQIFPVPIEASSGYRSVIMNAGQIQNKGIEVEANYKILQGKSRIGWKTYGTFSFNDNLIVSLHPDVETYVMSTGPGGRGTVEARAGERMGAIWGLGYERSPDGQIIYDDNGYAIRTEEAIYLGNTTARTRAGFGNEFSYKNFRLNLLFDGQFGGKGYSLTHAVLAEEGKLTKTLPGRYNGIIGIGVQRNADGTFRPNNVVATDIAAFYDEHYNRDNVEANLFSTDFIKFREARLDYTFSKKQLSKLKLKSAKVGVYGRDLLVFSNWPAFDPEFATLNGSEITAGFEVGQFPSTRTFGVNLTVEF